MITSFSHCTKKPNPLATLAMAICLVAAIPNASASTAVISGNELLGFNGVSVNGSDYNVAFEYNSYDAVYGYNSPTPEAFSNTQANAIYATNALVTALEDPTLSGLLFSTPGGSDANGPTSDTVSSASIWTPYADSGAYSYSEVLYQAVPGSGAFGIAGDVQSQNLFTPYTPNIWAKWTLASSGTPSTVPLPASLPLFASGLIAITALRFRRQQS